jgi:hypothetical protein
MGEKRCIIFADVEEVEMEVRKLLRQQSKDLYAADKAMGQVYQCWWRIYREVNIFSSGSNIICFISIFVLFTDTLVSSGM